MEQQSEFVAALDLGTSKMIAMAARRNEQGNLSLLGVEKAESENCIRRGSIYNIDKTAKKVTHLIADLGKKLDTPIGKIYVGVGGQSIRTVAYTVKRDVEGLVTQRIVDSLEEEVRQYKPLLEDVLEIVSPDYYLDGKLEDSYQIGIPCKVIEARFLLVLGSPSLKKYLTTSVEEKAGIPIAGFFISPLATAKAVLNDTEKDLGCALVEFGAGITYVSVYKGKLLRYLVAIPLGGNVITKDITDLGVTEKEAEEMKINFGDALLEQDNEDKLSNGITLKNLNMVVEARADEIIANVMEQIKLSGYMSSLGAGIVITGGGASLKNLRASLQAKSGKDVRVLSPRKTLVNLSTEILNQPENSTVIGLLSKGKENCAKEKPAPGGGLFSDVEITRPTPTPVQEGPKVKKEPKHKDTSGKEKGKEGGWFTRKISGFADDIFGAENNGGQ
jgi:cell division protein FtsA